MSICYPPGPICISPTERETAQIYSSYDYVFEAMAEGLNELLETPNASHRIPPGVLDAAKEFFQEAVEATKDTPPRNRARSAFLWAMVMENLPKEYGETKDEDLSRGLKRVARKVDGLASLVSKLENVKKIPDVKKESYLMLQRFFQSLSYMSEGYKSLLRESDDDDE